MVNIVELAPLSYFHPTCCCFLFLFFSCIFTQLLQLVEYNVSKVDVGLAFTNKTTTAAATTKTEKDVKILGSNEPEGETYCLDKP